MNNKMKNERIKNREGNVGVAKRSKFVRVLIKLALIAVVGVAILVLIEMYVGWRSTHGFRNPIVVTVSLRSLIETIEPVSPMAEDRGVEAPEPKQVWHGEASYYSIAGCLGCDIDRVMANGEVVDDMRKTLAFNYLPMNTEVVVTNLTNGLKTDAVITDTGGFNQKGREMYFEATGIWLDNNLDRVADLSFATKKVLDCGDLCQIRVEVF